MVVLKTQDISTKVFRELPEILSLDHREELESPSIGSRLFQDETLDRSLVYSSWYCLDWRVSNLAYQCFGCQEERFQRCLDFVLVSSCLGVSTQGRPLLLVHFHRPNFRLVVLNAHPLANPIESKKKYFFTTNLAFFYSWFLTVCQEVNKCGFLTGLRYH